MTKTFASLFSGFGLADVGAIAAGYEPIWGIEIEPQVAEVYAANLGNHVIAKSVLDVDPMRLERPDALWASPLCQSFSTAKINGKETSADMAIAQRVVDFLKVLTPKVFILENVEAYKRSKSLEFIEGALYALGYWCDRQILNSADFGVPQTRRRLILRAVHGGFPTPLPPAQKWIGWYEAIADLIPGLPESQFANWQLERMPSELLSTCLVHPTDQRTMPVAVAQQPCFTLTQNQGGNKIKAFIVSDQRSHAGTQLTIREGDRPCYTVEASKSGVHAGRAFIVDGLANNNGQDVTIRMAGEPMMTISASSHKRVARAWLESGRVVRMSARAIARFQTLPDTYVLPDSNKLACHGIGNGVPCKFAQHLLLAANAI